MSDRSLEIERLTTPGLGDDTSIVIVGGLAVVVDPQRDIERVLAIAEAHRASVRWVLETHVHNDYVSGARALAAATGAEVAGPADAGYAFAFRAMRDGDALPLGDAELAALATPGHTPEHTAYVLWQHGSPVAVFSGGSLIVGSVGRTDLLGDALTTELTRAQFESVRRLAAFDDGVLLFPTHGAGSFCASAPASDVRRSTIGDERRTNPLLKLADEGAFERRALEDLPEYPVYYARMAPMNRAGVAEPRDVTTARALPPDAFAEAVAAGAVVVDARDGEAFAHAHIPGSLNVPVEESFGSYVGWLVPFDATLALVMPDDDGALLECLTQLFRIGYDRIAGVLDGGIDAWSASGRATSRYGTVDARALADEVRNGSAGSIVDVRQRSEWDEGHLDGSRHVFVGDVPGDLASFDRGAPTTVVCASGFRSSIAASLLDAAGLPVRVLVDAGAPKVLALLRRDR